MASIPLQTPVKTYALFDSNAVALATLFGTPAAGGSLMALNYSRLGQGAKAAATLIVTILITVVAIFIGWNLPRGATLPIGLALLYGMRWCAQSLQGQAVQGHIERAGRLGSKGLAFGYGIAIFAVLFAAIFIPLYKADNRYIQIGAHDEVYYSGSATKEDAQALGTALKGNGYLADRGVTVILSKEKTGAIISFVVKQGIWDQPGMLSQFEEMGREVAPSVGGFPIQVRLVDREREVKKESTVGKVALPDNDTVYYSGTATESQAKALGQALRSADYFGGKEADVFLAKHSDGVALSFVVGKGLWDDPAVVSEFEKIARQVAPSIGGLPIKLRLVNTSLEEKKVDEIQ